MHNKEVKKVIEELNTNVNSGLTEEEVSKRREKYGFNELRAKKKQSLFVKFLLQFKDILIIILIIAGIISWIVDPEELL